MQLVYSNPFLNKANWTYIFPANSLSKPWRNSCYRMMLSADSALWNLAPLPLVVDFSRTGWTRAQWSHRAECAWQMGQLR